MKIGFLGNTNNYPFMMAMFFRDMGHSLFFVVTEKALLHRPESRYPEFEGQYPDWVLDLSHLSEWDFMSLHPEVAGALDQLSQCDALILNSVGPSLLPLLNKPAIALLTGSDLSNYANPLTVEARTALWDMEYRESPQGENDIAILQDFITRQRQGIQKSIAVRYFPRGCVPEDDRLLDEMGIPDSRRHFFQIANLDLLTTSPAPHNQPLRVFCGARLTWKLPVEPGRSPLDYKGIDIMIRGMGLFYRQTGIRLEIRLVRKGLHIKETEELIAEEGIADQITWLEEMSLVNYWQEIVNSDIVFDQLAEALAGSPTFDAMAIGRPVISNARREVYDIFGEASPICQAKTAQEVCEQLHRLVFKPEEREMLGIVGRRYVEKHFNPRDTAESMLRILENALSASNGQTSHGTVHSFYLQKIDSIQQEMLRAQQELLHTQQELKKITPRSYILRKIFQNIVKRQKS